MRADAIISNRNILRTGLSFSSGVALQYTQTSLVAAISLANLSSSINDDVFEIKEFLRITDR